VTQSPRDRLIARIAEQTDPAALWYHSPVIDGVMQA